MRKILAFSLMFVFVMAFGAAAQFGGKAQQGPNFYADFKPVVGGWAEYRMTPQKEAPTRMKVAIVGKEGQAYWYETQLNAGGKIVTKVLVSGDPKDQKNVKRMIMKQGSEPAMEMPVMSQGTPVKAQRPEGKVIDKGMEKITVPAGTFTARHVQYQQGKDVVDTWVSDKVSPYGMVKTKSKDMEMVLLGYGTGAKSLITEKPRKFQMPKMPQGMPKGMVPGMNLPGQE
ncbi:MAG: hypothetical protein ABFD70_00160 [Syntrophaceae bacterium]